MPVDLTSLPDAASPNAGRPTLLASLLLGALILGAGAALVLWQWPKDKPTNHWHFWTWLTAVPALACGLLLALRWHLYEQSLARTEAYNRQRQHVIDHNTTFARHPLALVASTYIAAMGDKALASRITRHESVLGYRAVRGIGTRVSHTGIVSQRAEKLKTEKRRTQRDALPLTDDDLLTLFAQLIGHLKPTLAKLPPQIVVPVQLVVSGNQFPLNVGKQWEIAWRSFGLPPLLPKAAAR